eukprot:2222418-Amphidinium_carterae.1
MLGGKGREHAISRMMVMSTRAWDMIVLPSAKMSAACCMVMFSSSQDRLRTPLLRGQGEIAKATPGDTSVLHQSVHVLHSYSSHHYYTRPELHTRATNLKFEPQDGRQQSDPQRSVVVVPNAFLLGTHRCWRNPIL